MNAALTIAGSDSGGAAGIQTDLRTFTANGVFGCSAITAVTAQNPCGVSRIDGLPPECVRSQIDAVCSVLNIQAVKTGMLFSAEIIGAVAEALKKMDCPVVVDPVMISTSGARLLKEDALVLFREQILPLADWVTPNIPEAEFLTGLTVQNTESAVRAAEMIAARWHTNVVLKGGHAENDRFATDVVCSEKTAVCYLTAPRLAVAPLTTHGTGCTFSAALAAALAKGETAESALISAKAFVLGSLAEAQEIGKAGTGLSGMFPPQTLQKYRMQIQLRNRGVC